MRKELHYKEFNKCVVHCSTEKQAIDFIDYCRQNNITWNYGDWTDNYWYKFKENTCYLIYRFNNEYNIVYENIKSYQQIKEYRDNIIEWEDYMDVKKNEFNHIKHLHEAIHCKTIEEAKDFARYCDEHDIHWCIDNGKVSNELFWHVHKENTCYYFEYPHKISYSRIGYFEDNDYKIIEWSDYMNTENKFTKADLKSGDVCVARNGDVEIVCLETDTLILTESFNYLDDINDDLTDYEDEKEFDIVKVYRPTRPHHCQFDPHAYEQGELVYERKDESTEMTIAEIEEALGIKNLKVVEE
jgi:hypothetical protein